jgi:hypothetical protein
MMNETIEFYPLRDSINDLLNKLDMESMSNPPHMGALQYPLHNLNYMNVDVVSRLRNKILENINSNDASLQAHISIARRFIEDITLIALRIGLDIDMITNKNLMNIFQQRLDENLIEDDITKIMNKTQANILINNSKNFSMIL